MCGNGPTLIAACPSGQECLEQAYEPSGGGACYTKCTPPTAGASTCPAGTTCIQVDYRGQTGACEALGTAQRGQACTYSQIASGCADGSQCVVEEAGSFCRGQCSIWGSAACDSGQRCVAGGYCTADVYDPAPLGSNCATGHDNYYCGDDGTAYRGICVTGCQKICRATSDCPANHTCAYLAGTDLGVCNQN